MSLPDHPSKDEEKRSKWKIFGSHKDKRKSGEVPAPESSSLDSTYGTNEPNNSLKTEADSNMSTSKSPNVFDKERTSDTENQPKLVDPLSHTSPPIKRETVTNPNTGQTITTTTTTTTTTTVTNSNGTTSTVEEPRQPAELPTTSNQKDTITPPPATPPNESVGDDQLPVSPTDQTTDTHFPRVRRQSVETPGNRIIPPRDPNSLPIPVNPMTNTNIPTIPERNANRNSFDDSMVHPLVRQPRPVDTNQHTSAANVSQPSNVPAQTTGAGFPQNHACINPPDQQQKTQPSGGLRQQSTIHNLKQAAAGIHVSSRKGARRLLILISSTQGAGETLRGTLNSTADRRFGNQQTMEKNQRTIDAGRYEIENQRFYHPDEHPHEKQPELPNPYQGGGPVTPPLYQVPFDDTAGSSWSVSGGANANERGRQSSRSKLGNFLSKATGRPINLGGADDEAEPTPVPQRAKLQKRSSSRLSGSRLSVVGE